MTVREFYDVTGGDFEDALQRLMRDNLVQKFALKFENDPTYPELKKAVEAGDIENSFRMAHTLKGVAGNLGFARLYRTAYDLTEQLRPRTAPADAGLYADVTAAYECIMENLEKLKNS